MELKLQLLCYSRLPCSASTMTSAAATSVTYLKSTASSSHPPNNTDRRDVAANVDNDRYSQHRKQLRTVSGKTLQLQVSLTTLVCTELSVN